MTFTTSVTFDKAGYWPDFQYEYGAGDYRKTTINNGHMTNGLNPDEYSFYTVDADHSDTGKKVNAFASRYQFGEKIQGQMRYMYASYDPATDTYTRMPYKVYDWYKGFFQTGVTYTNSLAVDASDGHGSSLRVSIKDTRNDWIVPNTGFTTQNFGVSAVSKRNKYIEAGVKLNYYRKNSDNLPVGGYSNSSPLKTLLWQPVSASARDAYNEWKSGRLIDYYSGVDTSVKLINGSMDNPYFIVYDCLNTQSRDRVYGNASVTGHIIPGRLSVTLRSGLDFSSDFRTQCKPQYTHAYLDGMYREQTIRSMELNNDFLVSYHDTFGQLSLNASLGGNNMLYKYHNSRQTANMLEEPNVFILQNVNGTLDFANTRKTKSINSFYGLVSLGWRDMLFLDVTGRNDWSSTLAPGYNSYFYPSVSASVLLDEVFKLHDKAKWIDMLKVRGSWANVGNDTEPYQLWGAYANSSVFTGAYGLPGSTKNYTLKPENVESWELGFEGHFLQNRVSFDFAYYDSETTNQIINVPSDWATGASSMVINAGCVRNRGIELAARFRPVSTKNWRWDIDVNWSKNWNELVELPRASTSGAQRRNTIGAKFSSTLSRRRAGPHLRLRTPDGSRRGLLLRRRRQEGRLLGTAHRRRRDRKPGARRHEPEGSGQHLSPVEGRTDDLAALQGADSHGLVRRVVRRQGLFADQLDPLLHGQADQFARRPLRRSGPSGCQRLRRWRLLPEQHHHHRCGRLLQHGHLPARQYRIERLRHLVPETQGAAGRIPAAPEPVRQDEGVPERFAVVFRDQCVLHHQFPAVRPRGGLALRLVALPRRGDGRLSDDPFLRIQPETRILKQTQP